MPDHTALLEDAVVLFRGSEITRIRNNGLTLYYSGGTVTDDSGTAVSGADGEPAATVLLRLAHRLCTL